MRLKERPMKSLLVLLAGLCCAADAPLPGLRVEAVPDGSILIVRNLHTAPLVAVLVEMVGYPGGSFQLLQDEVEREPIGPGQERRYQVLSMLAGVAPDYLKVQAAVYSDGTTSGAPGKVDRILSERRNRLKVLREQIERLRNAERALTASKPSLN
jgi:hypothetical protein